MILAIADMTDVLFALRGRNVRRDYAPALHDVLAGQLDWLDHEPAAGIHPLTGVSEGEGELYLNRRACLVLRLPRTRAAQSFGLSGLRVHLGGEIEVGDGRVRELLPYPVLYSRFVAMGTAEETAFLADAEAELGEIGITCRMICGKARQAQDPEGIVRGFSLMLHGLKPNDSLRAQQAGLGAGRKRGRGIFVPHKSLAAVGE